MSKLFTDFEPADYESWIKQIQKDLKDQPMSALESNPEFDLSIIAYHHPQANKTRHTAPTYANNFLKVSNDWAIRKIYTAGSNKAILKDLNEGINAVSLEATDVKQFQSEQEGILFEHILSDIRFESLQAAIDIPVSPHTILNFDVLSLRARSGVASFSMNDFIQFYQARKENKSIWIDGFMYGESGASTVQELAFTLAHISEYLHALKSAGASIQEINQKLVVELSVHENYFVHLAKFRAFRELIVHLFSAFEPGYQATVPILFAKTSSRFLARNDRNNNFIRQTTQAMSAVLGGCDVLTINNPLGDTPEEKIQTQRMSKNIQLVLKEEAYLDKVVDPAAGSMFIEDLTDQIIEKSWTLFCELEDKGGLQINIENNTIQHYIDKNKNYLTERLANGKQTFLGVNKYPSNLENWIDTKTESSEIVTAINPLKPFLLENMYQKKTVES